MIFKKCGIGKRRKKKEKRKEFLESERLNASFESKRNDFDTEV